MAKRPCEADPQRARPEGPSLRRLPRSRRVTEDLLREWLADYPRRMDHRRIARVLFRRYCDAAAPTLAQVGVELGVGGERVRQIEAQGIFHLSRPKVFARIVQTGALEPGTALWSVLERRAKPVP